MESLPEKENTPVLTGMFMLSLLFLLDVILRGVFQYAPQICFWVRTKFFIEMKADVKEDEYKPEKPLHESETLSFWQSESVNAK